MEIKNELPPIKGNEIKDFVTPSQNSFYFYMRFKKPLKLVESTRKFFDSSILLTKLQRAKLKSLKIQMKLLQKENLKKYNYPSHDNKYKNMMPLKIWNNCQKIYEECKQEHKINLKNNEDKKETNHLNRNFMRNSSMKNLRIGRKAKNKFENQGLDKFIENIDKSNINNIHKIINNLHY